MFVWTTRSKPTLRRCLFLVSFYIDGYSTDRLIFRWNEVPVELAANMSLPKFFLGDITTSVCDRLYTGGEYMYILCNNYEYFKPFSFIYMYKNTTFFTFTLLILKAINTIYPNQLCAMGKCQCKTNICSFSATVPVWTNL